MLHFTPCPRDQKQKKLFHFMKKLFKFHPTVNGDTSMCDSKSCQDLCVLKVSESQRISVKRSSGSCVLLQVFSFNETGFNLSLLLIYTKLSLTPSVKPI